MQLTQDQIKEFQEIHQKKTGEILSAEEAREMGVNLVNLVNLVYRPIKKADYVNNINKK